MLDQPKKNLQFQMPDLLTADLSHFWPTRSASAHTGKHTHTSTHTHARTHAHTDTHIHLRVHAHTHTHIRVHAHTHTQEASATTHSTETLAKAHKMVSV